jgi:hypothetical protein
MKWKLCVGKSKLSNDGHPFKHRCSRRLVKCHRKLRTSLKRFLNWQNGLALVLQENKDLVAQKVLKGNQGKMARPVQRVVVGSQE